MTTRRRHQFIALIMGACLSATWLSTVVVGMQSACPHPTHHRVAPVVIVARKASAPQATHKLNQRPPNAAKLALPRAPNGYLAVRELTP
jgi:hypothetical protein